MKRVTRTYEISKTHKDFIQGKTHLRMFDPCDKDEVSFAEHGLVGSINVSKRDLAVLDMPTKIRVTISTIY